MKYDRLKRSKKLTRNRAVKQAAQLTNNLSELATKKEDAELLIHSINAWMQLGNYAEEIADSLADENDLTSHPIGVGFSIPEREEYDDEGEDEEFEDEEESIVYPEPDEEAT